MNAVITYNEISNFISKKFMICPVFTTVDDRTLEVSYSPFAFMPAINVKFRIEEIRNDFMCISYECGIPASLMISGVVAYLRKKIPSGIDVYTADKYINIYPQQFTNFDKILKYISLSTIAFDVNSIKIALTIL
jgi:hypothetical protein